MSLLASHVLDFLRLLAVPVFIWAAIHDIKTRRVSNTPWLVLAGVGGLLLVVDAALILGGFPTHRYPPTFWRDVALSIGLVFPLAYGAWALNLFGGADAKALMALAVLFPTTPAYTISLHAIGITETVMLPQYVFPVSVFAFTVFANAILLSTLYPVSMAVRNLLNGRFNKAILFARPVSVDAIGDEHGITFETPAGFGRGLDLDVLRSYLTWADCSLQELTREHTATSDVTPDVSTDTDDEAGEGDAWDAAAFFAATDDLTYGMTPEDLRAGLTVLTTRDTVWVSPGLPYMVPFALGLAVALTYGNLMIALLILLQ